ncbi:MAG: DUF3352 domain-containing protein [Candidatus Aminicenantes bacterium]|nr:DUF3352 domain-containing protein [Candidatus Aminicenantes bacterium]
MRKSAALVLLLLFALAWPSCAKKPAAPQAGSATAEDMMSLLPRDAAGMIVVDVHRIMETEAVQKAIQQDENYQKYQEFVQETGIDPKKDVFFFVAAMRAGAGQEKAQEGVALINLKYNRDLLLEKMKKEGTEIQESEYNGFTVYQGIQREDEKPFSGAFLDDSNIVAGNDTLVRNVIDVYQKKADNILKNAEMAGLIKGMNKSAMVYGAFLVPPGAMQEAAAQNPMLSTFQSITAVLLSFDYQNKSLLAEIKAQSVDAEKNKQIADALNGFKALGAAAASKEPELGELLNRIEIISTPAHVKISASVPEALLETLSQKLKPQKEQPENPED